MHPTHCWTTSTHCISIFLCQLVSHSGPTNKNSLDTHVVTPTVRQAHQGRSSLPDATPFLIRPSAGSDRHSTRPCGIDRSMNSNPFLDFGIGSHRLHCPLDLHLHLHCFSTLVISSHSDDGAHSKMKSCRRCPATARTTLGTSRNEMSMLPLKVSP
jgi:hypothetical protein